MLTLDHVKLRRKKGLVEVVPLCGVARERALELAGFAVEAAQAHAGEARAALEDALDELPVGPPVRGGGDEVRLARGLKKLTLDACDFDVDTTLDPEAVRAEVFGAAARARLEGAFDRARVLADAAALFSSDDAGAVSTADVERALFADLSAAHAVRGLDVGEAAHLVERYEVAELQAVLLRAVRLTVDVEASALELRGLLRALKLHQLLFEVDGGDGVDVDGAGTAAGTGADSVRLVVEGPMGLFQQSTRYGLKLALLLPHVLACRRFVLDAEVKLRPGGAVERLVVRGARGAAGDAAAGAARLPEVTRALLDDIGAAGGRFTGRVATEILRVPGAGVIVPDVVLEDAATGEVVYVEVLGFWSRAAVWKRVELVDKGLPYRVVFCASERLRVSEQALPEEAPSALVVFKGVLRASRVLEAAARLARS